MKQHRYGVLVSIVFLLGIVTGCGELTRKHGSAQIVTTTSMVYDVTTNITKGLVKVYPLIPPGSDPHGYEPTPKDIAALSKADVVFINGFHLESNIEPYFESAGVTDRVVSVSLKVKPLRLGAGFTREPHGHDHSGHGHSSHDPHVWLNPNNVAIWTSTIAESLAHLYPDKASQFRANAGHYIKELQELDEWIAQTVENVPTGSRKLVGDHYIFSYFAEKYGFEQSGALVAGFSTLSQPNASDLATLVKKIKSQNVPAIFVELTTNPALAEQVSADTGVKIIPVYTGSLSKPGGGADTYLNYMRFNVSQIVEALSSKDRQAK